MTKDNTSSHVTFRPTHDGRLAPQTLNAVGLEPGEIFTAAYGLATVGPLLITG